MWNEQKTTTEWVNKSLYLAAAFFLSLAWNKITENKIKTNIIMHVKNWAKWKKYVHKILYVKALTICCMHISL